MSVMTDRTLGGQWAVVTGGSKGIGQAIGRRLGAAGANVVLVARGQPALDEAVAVLRKDLDDDQMVLGIVADMADTRSIDALFDTLRAELPHLNVFVANAGTGHVTPFLELSAEERDGVVGLNFVGAIHGMQRAAQLMVERPTENQTILAVSSIRALGAKPGRLIYAATKAGLNQAIRVAAVELAPHGIRVCGVSPGITETPLAAAHPDAFADAVRHVPLGRAAQPEELAEAAYFLCSPQARFVTGANLVVDGGESLA
jgi:NAD(P)-dependent dehydrogenase (short-subunit alcohol dehydrogenase family)